MRWYAEQVGEGRKRMMDGLRGFGVPYWESAANFVLMNIGGQHKAFCEAMRDRGVLVRDRSSDPGCDGFVRITIGVEDHVTRGLAAIDASLEAIGWVAPAGHKAAGPAEGEPEYE